MSLYEVGNASVAPLTGAPYCTFHAATTRDARLREFGAFCNAATVSSFSIARPANTPVATTSVLGNPVNPDTQVAALVNTDTAWSTVPTAPTVKYRTITLPATTGAGYVAVWNPGEEIVMSKTAGTTQWIVIWNFGAGTASVLNYYAKWDE